VTNLGDALLGIRTHEIGGPDPSAGHQASLWLSTWGREQSEMEAFAGRLQDELSRWVAGKTRPITKENQGS
jgi:hypothetical protein